MKNIIAILALTVGITLLIGGCKKDDPKPEPEKSYYYKYDVVDSKGCKIASRTDCLKPSDIQRMMDEGTIKNAKQYTECN